MKSVAAFAAVVAFVLAAPAAQSAGVADEECAFQESVTVEGVVATSMFHVVRDNCQVSLVSISKFADGNAIFDTATGIFAESETRYRLSVTLPCGYDAETDLVLGPPALYPPSDLDLGFRNFRVPCPAGGGGGSTSGGGGASGGGGGSSGGGPTTGNTNGTALPDLKTTVSSSKKNRVRLGDVVDVTVTVVNNGQGAASGVHALITPALTMIQKGKAVASRGPGCSGLALIDCDLGSLGAGASAVVRLRLSAASGHKFFVAATAQRSTGDANPVDDTSSLTIKLLPKLIRFTVSAAAGRIVAGEQFAVLKLSSRATVTAQIYVGGAAQPIGWRRTLNAGTSGVRVPLPKLAKGRRFTIVFRATSGTRKSSTMLRLVD